MGQLRPKRPGEDDIIIRICLTKIHKAERENERERALERERKSACERVSEQQKTVVCAHVKWVNWSLRWAAVSTKATIESEKREKKKKNSIQYKREEEEGGKIRDNSTKTK